MSVQELEAEIMRLAPMDQAYLFEKLGQLFEYVEEPLTKEELDRRFEELRSGKDKGMSLEEMLASVRKPE